MSEETEIALLKAKVDSLEKRILSDEDKIQKLLDELVYLRNALRTGKGVLIGIAFGMGTIGLAAFDKLRDLFKAISS